ncbi:MAG: hypothetical protein IT185_12425 [Acidobacteria bacterium]|nr:hypothetical protein [Acidobacteriota bacterium]
MRCSGSCSGASGSSPIGRSPASNPGLNAGEPRKYTGKERDKENGLDYFGARYYGAKTGRFTASDPVYTWKASLAALAHGDPQARDSE